MSEPVIAVPVALQVVLADSNVLYSRVLRDYLLYAAEEEIISVVWSERIPKDTTKYLMKNRENFDVAAAKRLEDAMTQTFPYANTEPSERDYAKLEGIVLRDEGDRHVMAAAVAAEADIICTSNVKHFPRQVMAQFGIVIMEPDALFTQLIYSHLTQMISTHQRAVANFRGATDDSTLTALRICKAGKTAELMQAALGL